MNQENIKNALVGVKADINEHVGMVVDESLEKDNPLEAAFNRLCQEDQDIYKYFQLTVDNPESSSHEQLAAFNSSLLTSAMLAGYICREMIEFATNDDDLTVKSLVMSEMVVKAFKDRGLNDQEA